VRLAAAVSTKLGYHYLALLLVGLNVQFYCYAQNWSYQRWYLYQLTVKFLVENCS